MNFDDSFDPDHAPGTPAAMRALIAARLRLRHLNCIVAIAQERTLARAAARLNLSQPAVSKTLAELEQWAGARLVERGRNGAALTAAGEHFLRYALDVRRAVEASASALTREDLARVQSVRIGALPTVEAAVLPPAILRVQAVMPQLGVKIHSDSNSELLRALKAGEVDLMIGRMAEPASMQGVSFEYLYTESLAMAARAGHPLARAGAAATLEDALAYPLVIAGEHTAPRHHTEAFFESRGLALPPGCVETQSAAVARAVVQASEAVWIVPLRVVEQELAAGALARIEVPAPHGVEPVGMLRRTTVPLSDAAQAFMEALREAQEGEGKGGGKD